MVQSLELYQDFDVIVISVHVFKILLKSRQCQHTSWSYWPYWPKYRHVWMGNSKYLLTRPFEALFSLFYPFRAKTYEKLRRKVVFFYFLKTLNCCEIKKSELHKSMFVCLGFEFSFSSLVRMERIDTWYQILGRFIYTFFQSFMYLTWVHGAFFFKKEDAEKPFRKKKRKTMPKILAWMC